MASRKGGVGGSGHSGGFTIDMDQDRPSDPEAGSEDTRPLLDSSEEGKPAFLAPPPEGANGSVKGVVDRHNRCCDNKFWCIKARREGSKGIH